MLIGVKASTWGRSTIQNENTATLGDTRSNLVTIVAIPTSALDDSTTMPDEPPISTQLNTAEPDSDDDSDTSTIDSCAAAEVTAQLDLLSEYPRTHHFNWFGLPVHHRTTTPPSVSLAIILSDPKPYTYDKQEIRKHTVLRNALSYIDPILYTGPVETLYNYSGTALQEAVTGLTQKLYSPFGNHMYDLLDLDEDHPADDHMDERFYNPQHVVLNGWYFNHGMPLRSDIVDESYAAYNDLMQARRRSSKMQGVKSSLSDVVNAEDHAEDNSTIKSTSPTDSVFTVPSVAASTTPSSSDPEDWKAKLAALDAEESELENWADESEQLERGDKQTAKKADRGKEWSYGDWKARLDATFVDEPEDWSEEFEYEGLTSPNTADEYGITPDVIEPTTSINSDINVEDEAQNEQLSPITGHDLLRYIGRAIDDGQPLPTLPTELPLHPEFVSPEALNVDHDNDDHNYSAKTLRGEQEPESFKQVETAVSPASKLTNYPSILDAKSKDVHERGPPPTRPCESELALGLLSNGTCLKRISEKDEAKAASESMIVKQPSLVVSDDSGMTAVKPESHIRHVSWADEAPQNISSLEQISYIDYDFSEELDAVNTNSGETYIDSLTPTPEQPAFKPIRHHSLWSRMEGKIKKQISHIVKPSLTSSPARPTNTSAKSGFKQGMNKLRKLFNREINVLN